MTLDQEIKQLLTPPSRATYMVEVYFDGNFSVAKPNVGVISLWTRLDTGFLKMYQCPECEEFINPSLLGDMNQLVPCTHCQKVTAAKNLIGEKLFKMPVDKWAFRLATYLRKLNMDADLVLKRSKFSTSIIEASPSLTSGGDPIKLAESREKEGGVYMKERMSKDTLQASLEEALKAFLLA